MFIIRFLLIFIVLFSVTFFFWKTLLTTRYFRDRRRLRKIILNAVLSILSIIVAIFVISIIMELG